MWRCFDTVEYSFLMKVASNYSYYYCSDRKYICIECDIYMEIFLFFIFIFNTKEEKRLGLYSKFKQYLSKMDVYNVFFSKSGMNIHTIHAHYHSSYKSPLWCLHTKNGGSHESKILDKGIKVLESDHLIPPSWFHSHFLEYLIKDFKVKSI